MSELVTSWQGMSQLLMHRSFQSSQPRLLLWIRSNALCWKRLIRRLKMVGSACRTRLDECDQLTLDMTQLVFPWIQLLDLRHAYTSALPHETTKHCCLGIQSPQRNILALALARLFWLIGSVGSTTFEVPVSHLTRRVPAA